MSGLVAAFLGIPEGILADFRTSIMLIGDVGDTGDVISSLGPAPERDEGLGPGAGLGTKVTGRGRLVGG